MVKIPKKLMKETRALVQLRFFLNECGLKKLGLSLGELRELLGVIKK